MKKLLVVLVVVSSLVIVGLAQAGPIDWVMDLIGYSPTSQLIAAKAEISRLESIIVVLTRINWVGLGVVVMLIVTGEVIRRWIVTAWKWTFKKRPPKVTP